MQNEIVSRQAWLQARAALLRKEKAHTRARAELAAERRKLPWVKVDKDYRFAGPEGELTFAELFLDRSQLAVYHLMFGAGWDAPCPGCTQWANALNGTTGAFKRADARLIAISRAPYAEIAEQRERLGWKFAWLSSHGGDFNIDYYASPAVEGAESAVIGGEQEGQGGQEAREAQEVQEVQGETVGFDRGENHGVSVFYKNDEGEIFHTYSAYNRGIEALNGAFGYFDLLPKGRAW